MTNLLSIQTALCLIFILVVSNKQVTALGNDSCQVYPSEYAYKTNSVFGSERSIANCGPYASGLSDIPGVLTEHYTHCDGSRHKLTDSDLGSQQYCNSKSDCYVWNAGTSGYLLFIFPRRVNLTTITLHYYSDSARGLPGLRFNAVPDHFDVWNATSASYSRVDSAAVPPGGEPAGRRNVRIHLNFTTKRVLLYKHSSNFTFAVSEVEFSTCIEIAKSATTVSVAMVTKTSNSADSEIGSTFPNRFTTTNEVVNLTNTGDQDITLLINHTGTQDEVGNTAPTDKFFILVGTVVAIVILLILSVMLAIVLYFYLRKSTKKRKVDYVDSSYSTLCRESGQQTQSQSLHISDDLYDQIQLSPSTGQAEFISRNETANTNNPAPHQTEYGIHPSVGKDKPKSAKLKITASTISTQDEDKSTSEQPTYAVVNKKKKQKTERESVHCENQNIAEVSQNEGVTEQNAIEHENYLHKKKDSPDTITQFPSQTIESPEKLYTAVKTKPKDRLVENKKVPTIPPYTTEELYSAVKKKTHASTAGDDEEAPQIPPHTIEELYTVVQKKPKANATVDEEKAPPAPAHTVEELYTAVVKKPKVSTAEDEEEAPPVPPYTVDEL